MDIQKPRTQSKFKKRFWSVLVVIVIVALSLYVMRLPLGTYKVSRDSLLISQVSQGNMNVEVRGNGILASKQVRWISTNVDGRVETVFVKPGAIVKQGDLITELINPELVQQTDEVRWTLEAALAGHKAMMTRQDSNILDAEARILEVRHAYEKAKLQYDAERTLLKRNNGSVSLIDYKRSKLDVEQYKEQLSIENQRLDKLRVTQAAELQANTAIVNKLKKSLEHSEMKIHSLKMISNQAGVIQAVNIEAGQRVPVGFNVAKLALQDQLIAELKIPERHVRDVALHQEVIIDTHNNKLQGAVIRIDPSVINGTVQVDVSLSNHLPPETRPDLSIEGTILVSKLKHVLYVNRPVSAQNNTPATVYKLSADGKEADKVRVMFGQGSADEIEIKSGLKLQDRIITSNTSAWEQLGHIRIE